jgi:hypothetical protein
MRVGRGHDEPTGEEDTSDQRGHKQEAPPRDWDRSGLIPGLHARSVRTDGRSSRDPCPHADGRASGMRSSRVLPQSVEVAESAGFPAKRPAHPVGMSGELVQTEGQLGAPKSPIVANPQLRTTPKTEPPSHGTRRVRFDRRLACAMRGQRDRTITSPPSRTQPVPTAITNRTRPRRSSL